MKPEKLIICGWGPYKEETVVDFTKLNTSLFLITGQTGAGKTTIFDAIAYALYGMLSGQVREKGSVRSDFADENTKTYVELYMSHKGESYHIIRNPEYLRPKKKKSGESAFTKEKENAALTLPDGSIIAGNQDVTRKVEELLGMDGQQFRQISMIAQGEFAKMLLASPNEKTAIFRELFGTGIYAALQSSLKDRAARLYRDYMNYKNKMDEDVHLVSFEDETWETLISHEQIDFKAVEEYLSEGLTQIHRDINEAEAQGKKAEEELLHLKEELAKIHQINKRFEELEENIKKKQELEEKREVMEAQEMRIRILREARLLSLEEKVVVQAEMAAKETAERLELYEQELTDCRTAMETVKELDAKKDIIREVYHLTEQITEIIQVQQDKERELLRLNTLLECARKEYTSAQKTADEKKMQYEEADHTYKNAVIGIAARFVEEGKPCPVCGSLVHPKVAEVSENVPDEKQLKKLKIEMEKAQQICNKCFEGALHYQNEERHLTAEIEKIKEELQKLKQKMQSVPEDVQRYCKENLRTVFEKELTRYLENQSKAVEKQKQIEALKRECRQKTEESLEARSRFNQTIIQNGFKCPEEYNSALEALKELPKMEKELAGYQEALAAVKSLCEHLKEAVKGLKRMDEEPLKAEFLQKQQGLQNIREKQQQCRIREDQMKRSLNGIRINRKKAEEIRQEYGIVKDLDDLANGNNARRLVFEQFVLAGYFEQILKAANLRLFKMTDGRYELIRARQVSDGRRKDNLEILVMDYYTGKERSVKTLSGGETFKASLCLALGMSDCIQAENGGLEVETLFIDEGFGALDEESLEQSCMVLQALSGVNRMIGIISHVPELRERIEHQIVIEKKNFGSSVRVLV